MAIIDKPSDYFNTKLYTGNGSTQSITGVGFQPYFTWIKSRNDTNSHFLFDAVRGATKLINSNSNNAESTQADTLTSFDSDGFSLGDGTGVNGNSDTEASWNWLAGTAVSGSTTGSGTTKTYTGSVNTTSGFSIIKFIGNGTAGHTIPHHLGAVPKMIIVKVLNAVADPLVYQYKNTTEPQTEFLRLNSTNATQDEATIWNDTAPTSSVFSLGTEASVNENGKNLIAYCFADVQGYSKFGSYTGNGNVDGPFFYTGFKPAFVMIKASSRTGDWVMYDNKRSVFNIVTKRLNANLNSAEDTDNFLDFCSNGIKIRNTYGSHNTSGETYIYMAFAENPFVTSTAIPATAR